MCRWYLLSILHHYFEPRISGMNDRLNMLRCHCKTVFNDPRFSSIAAMIDKKDTNVFACILFIRNLTTFKIFTLQRENSISNAFISFSALNFSFRIHIVSYYNRIICLLFSQHSQRHSRPAPTLLRTHCSICRFSLHLKAYLTNQRTPKTCYSRHRPS